METYAPIFPGFYSTVYEFDSDYDFIIDSLMENFDCRKHAFFDFLCSFVKENYEDVVNEDYKQYTEDVAKAVCDFLSETVSDVLKTDVEFEFQNIHSPKYYNFSNDSINVNLKMEDSDVFMRKLLSFVKKHKMEFAKYLKENYTSCDGFLSYYSNNIEDWIKEEYGEHEIGSMMEFVLRVSNPDIEDSMLFYVQDRVCAPSYCSFKDSFNRFMESDYMKTMEKEVESLERQKEAYVELMKSQKKEVSYKALHEQEKKNFSEMFAEMKDEMKTIR